MRILLVEDTKFFSRAVTKGLNERIGADVVLARSRAEARAILTNPDHMFDLALVDVILPDSNDGEVVNDVLTAGIPVIVFTGVYSDTFREMMLKRNIIDYVIKDSPASLGLLLDLVERLSRNADIPLLIVDDSETYRRQLIQLLERYRFKVIEAKSGREALEISAANPGIRLMITDYHMPDMNGVEVVKRIRGTIGPETLAIIGISSTASSALSAQFIKYGANDFLAKEFLPEELYCRVTQNLRMLELMDELKKSATTDFLTGLKNRAYFFDTGTQLAANQAREHISLTVAMLDIDHFKTVNDTYGHDAGDRVLKAVARTLKENVRATDLVARLGGEEFAFVLVNMDEIQSVKFFEKLRNDIAAVRVEYGDDLIGVTCSIGVACGGKNLEAALATADGLLYEAKREGRNKTKNLPSPATKVG